MMLFYIIIMILFSPYIVLSMFYLSVIFTTFNNKRRSSSDVAKPQIYIVTCFYNEEKLLDDKIKNLLSLDYPYLKFIFVNDNSTDRSVEIVKSFESENIILLDNRSRGKAEAQNTALCEIPRSAIVIFTDCNVFLDNKSIDPMVNCFAPDVGGVIGNVFIADPAGGRNLEGDYWEFEKKIKIFESYFGAVIGFDGGFYAVRADLYSPLPPDFLSDFEESLAILSKGYKVVFCSEAMAVELERRKIGAQFASRRRVTVRTLWALRRAMGILNKLTWPARLFLIINKAVRYYCLFLSPLMGIFIVSCVMQLNYMLGLLAIILCIATTGLLALSHRGRQAFATAYGLYAGLFDFCMGRKIISWEQQRQ